MSTSISAARMVSSSCSTTIKLLPKSRRFFKVAKSFLLSYWWSPIDGSSKTYKTPVNAEPICVASLILWNSPPLKVADFLDNVKYSNPTSFKNFNRDLISFKTCRAIWLSVSLSCNSSKKFAHLSTGISVTCAIFLSPTVTPRAAELRRCPWQSGQISKVESFVLNSWTAFIHSNILVQSNCWKILPSPSHVGQAPFGLLKEKSCGSMFGKLIPQSTQAFFSLKVKIWSSVST